jgi:flagellar basal-body rod protein FlgF
MPQTDFHSLSLGLIFPCGSFGAVPDIIILETLSRGEILKDLWVPVSGAVAQQKNVEVIANNVANVNTPGFKRDQVAFKEHLTVMEKGISDLDMPNKEWAPKDFYRSYGAEKAFVKINGTYSNFEQGLLTPTSNKLDFGIKGKGLFEILTPQGIRYTRKGTFAIDQNSRLVTSDGHQVLSSLPIPEEAPVEAGKPAPEAAPLPAPSERSIRVPAGQLSVNTAGEAYVNGTKIGQLSLVEFVDHSALKKEGNSFFINNDIKNLKTTGVQSSVHQGFIEQSNVNAVQEMSELIKAHRNFESLQRLIKTYDSLMGKSVNEINRF